MALAVIFVGFHSQRRLEPTVMGNACPHRSQVTQILVHPKTLGTVMEHIIFQGKCHCCLPLFVFKKSPKEVGYAFSLEDNSQSWKNLLELFNSEIL